MNLPIKDMADTAMAFTPMEHALMAIHSGADSKELMENAALILQARQTAAVERLANKLAQLVMMYAHDHDFELEDE